MKFKKMILVIIFAVPLWPPLANFTHFHTSSSSSFTRIVNIYGRLLLRFKSRGNCGAALKMKTYHTCRIFELYRIELAECLERTVETQRGAEVGDPGRGVGE
jgi:hypothetical protein